MAKLEENSTIRLDQLDNQPRYGKGAKPFEDLIAVTPAEYLLLMQDREVKRDDGTRISPTDAPFRLKKE